MQFFSYTFMMKNLETYFANDYVSNDDDPHVGELVRKAKSVLDVGCGDNQFKKYMQHGAFIGIDPFNKNADRMCDILEYESPFKYELIICFGSINFYNALWVDERMKKVATLLQEKGRMCFKVNPNKPFGNGVILEWFDKWTMPLIEHYAEMFDYGVENVREGDNGRIKFDYVAR